MSPCRKKWKLRRTKVSRFIFLFFSMSLCGNKLLTFLVLPLTHLKMGFISEDTSPKNRKERKSRTAANQPSITSMFTRT